MILQAIAQADEAAVSTMIKALACQSPRSLSLFPADGQADMDAVAKTLRARFDRPAFWLPIYAALVAKLRAMVAGGEASIRFDAKALWLATAAAPKSAKVVKAYVKAQLGEILLGAHPETSGGWSEVRAFMLGKPGFVLDLERESSLPWTAEEIMVMEFFMDLGACEDHGYAVAPAPRLPSLAASGDAELVEAKAPSLASIARKPRTSSGAARVQRVAVDATAA